MSPTSPIDPRRLFLVAAVGFLLWLLAAFLWHFTFATGRQVGHVLFLDQDFPVLLSVILGLVLLSSLAGGGRDIRLPAPSLRIIGPLVLLAALWSWAGHYLIFQDYALSRDEEAAEFASAYMRDGLIARPIPLEWLDYRRAIISEFFSPYGADRYWTSAYLPVNSAIRAAFWHLGDPNIAGPALLALGLLALWRVALRLFPDRPDAVWVVLLMALTSAQLSVTAMTPYAMTGHFALNMVWLALLLRGGWAGHVGAGMVALVAAGLHQWHFPLIFIAPFLLWMLLGRRWSALAFHLLVMGLVIGLWAKAWPAFLLGQLGPPVDIRPSAGVGDKVGSLFRRLSDKWQPLFNLTRFVAWNNILLIPLAILGGSAMHWRDAIRGRSIVLPLGMGCAMGCALALYQGYGWGFRYMHGFIGPFCLLAGFGWIRLGSLSMRPVLLVVGLSLVSGAFLTLRAHDYSAPYAAAHRLIHQSDADVVLVDARGGIFATDLVRGEHGDLGRPMVMNLAMLTPVKLDALCARYRVALFDRTAFLRLKVRRARFNDGPVSLLRAHLARIGCGRLIAPGL
ncbi:hypothetical protein BH10PSE12_BH10PSE12_12460 [soil metagenome]